MSRTYTNVYGRQAGRGLRPYLLLPKVLAVGVYFGGLVMMLVLVMLGAPGMHIVLPWVHDWVLLPALGVVMVLGAVLVGHHGYVLVRMRWLQVKVAIGLVGLIGGHVWLRVMLVSPHGGAVWPLSVLIGLAGVVIVLGRHKPRLGQNVANPRK